MMGSDCEEFTATAWWPLIEWLTEQLHRRLAQLRRGRAALVEEGPFLFDGRAPGLQCVGEPHYNPSHRPCAWVSVDVRLGEPIGVGAYGRNVWKGLTLEARLSETQQPIPTGCSLRPRRWRIVQDTEWRSSDAPWMFEDDLLPGMVPEAARRQHPTRLAPLALHAQLRVHAQRRLRDGVWRSPLTSPRVWIDPGETPPEVTKMALLLIFWQEGMVEFGPDKSSDAWAWVKRQTRMIHDDALCWEAFEKMRRNYVEPEDWRGLRIYLGKVIQGLRKSRSDALDYAMPLPAQVEDTATRRPDEVGGADDSTVEGGNP